MNADQSTCVLIPKCRCAPLSVGLGHEPQSVCWQRRPWLWWKDEETQLILGRTPLIRAISRLDELSVRMVQICPCCFLAIKCNAQYVLMIRVLALALLLPLPAMPIFTDPYGTRKTEHAALLNDG